MLSGWDATQRGVGHGIQTLTNAFVGLGAAYLALLIGLLSWSRGRSGREMQKAARLAPLFYTAILVAQQLFSAITPYKPDALGGNLADRVLGTLLIGIVFGYLFVLVAEAIHGVLDEAGMIHREGHSPGA
jgi:hypothetical protein